MPMSFAVRFFENIIRTAQEAERAVSFMRNQGYGPGDSALLVAYVGYEITRDQLVYVLTVEPDYRYRLLAAETLLRIGGCTQHELNVMLEMVRGFYRPNLLRLPWFRPLSMLRAIANRLSVHPMYVINMERQINGLLS